MSPLQALLLGAVQGITEFLPISSSGHLILIERLFGLHVEGLTSFDIVLHAGTLLALIVYFYRSLFAMAKSFFRDLRRLLFRRPETKEAALRDPDNPREQVWYLIVATLPVVLLAPLVKDVIEGAWRSPSAVIWQLAATAVFLVMAELFGKRTEGRVHSVFTALLMGFFQLIAIIPGVSRSGATITGGLLGGLTREAAARFSFLMAIPAIAGAVVFVLYHDSAQLFQEGLSFTTLAAGFLSSAIVSFFVIHGLLKFLRQRSLWWFVAYLVLLCAGWGILA